MTDLELMECQKAIIERYRSQIDEVVIPVCTKNLEPSYGSIMMNLMIQNIVQKEENI